MSGSATVEPNVVFNEIPYNILVPGTYMEVRANYTNAGTFAWPARVLITGQMSATGTATPLTPYPQLTPAQANALFGAGSQVSSMVWAFVKANPFTQFDVIGIADPTGGAKAAGSLALSGLATFAGVIYLTIGGVDVQVAVNAADTLTTVQANLIADINATPYMSVVASAGIGSAVTLTAKNAGTIGNMIDVRLNRSPGQALPPGLAIAITAMTGGTLTPNLSSVMAAVSNTWYTDIVQPFDDTGAFAATLDTYFMALGKKDAVAYIGVTGTYGTLIAAAGTYNSRFRVRIPTANSPHPPWIWAASVAGICSFQFTNDPSRQLKGLVLPGILAPAAADQFDDDDRGILLANGFTTFDVNTDGTVVLERVVSENKTDNNGLPTTAWRDIMIAKTTSRIRYDWNLYVGLQYPRAKLADDGTLAAEYDITTVTPKRMLGSWASRCTLYEQQGWIQNSATTVQASYFKLDPSDDNRLDGSQQVQIIGNMMVLAGVLEFQQ